eukprot:TRINITY_DN516_c0_g1_i2.p1 TRINITY_DN516_c0_g1~~TRINITY_DN516_c0_g1_i2.p1  ORF type:complete len:196 (+),score=30.73 TRINITY_DN516_c0_g1_i2:32-619(+)
MWSMFSSEPPSVPSANDVQQYNFVSTDTFNRILDLENEPSWKCISYPDKKVDLYDSKSDGPYSLLKLVGTINASPQLIYHVLTTTQEDERRKWEGPMAKSKVIEDIDDHLKVRFGKVTISMISSTYDYCLIQKGVLLPKNQGYGYLLTSIKNEGAPEDQTATRMIGSMAYLLRPSPTDPNSCECGLLFRTTSSVR